MAQQKATRDSKTVKTAREYVQRQIATMKAHGAAPKLSATAIKEIVHEVAAATKCEA
jgi:hypothetical protein